MPPISIFDRYGAYPFARIYSFRGRDKSETRVLFLGFRYDSQAGQLGVLRTKKQGGIEPLAARMIFG